jgi:CrcB protein
MRTLGAIALGGALGSLARHGVNVVFAQAFGRSVPYATASVNLAGAAAIGVLAGLIASEKLAMSADVRAFVFVGLLGGFTTFSSFMLDTLTLIQTGGGALAISNLAGQTVAGIFAVYFGYLLAAGRF